MQDLRHDADQLVKDGYKTMEHLFKIRSRCLPSYVSRDVNKISQYNKYEYAFKQTQKVSNFCPSMLQTAAYNPGGVISVTPKSISIRGTTSTHKKRNYLLYNRHVISPLHNRTGSNSPFSKTGHTNLGDNLSRRAGFLSNMDV